MQSMATVHSYTNSLRAISFGPLCTRPTIRPYYIHVRKLRIGTKLTIRWGTNGVHACTVVLHLHGCLLLITYNLKCILFTVYNRSLSYYAEWFGILFILAKHSYSLPYCYFRETGGSVRKWVTKSTHSIARTNRIMHGQYMQTLQLRTYVQRAEKRMAMYVQRGEKDCQVRAKGTSVGWIQ